ncbi:MAG: discoidin domain-containing protein [bacterium]|nr:discoidin domain-containing protein [bacterium]
MKSALRSTIRNVVWFILVFAGPPLAQAKTTAAVGPTARTTNPVGAAPQETTPAMTNAQSTSADPAKSIASGTNPAMTVNIARPDWGTAISASSQFSTQHNAANLADGESGKGNGWLSHDNASLPQQVTFMFEKPYPVVKIKVTQADWNEGMYRTRDFVAEVTADGKAWQKIGDGALDEASASTCEITCPPTPARGVRLTITSSYNPVQTCGLGEVEIYGQVPPGAQPPYPGSSTYFAFQIERGRFRLDLTLDPPAGVWYKTRGGESNAPAGDYKSGPYRLTLTRKETGPQACVVGWEITRADGLPFRVLESQLECKTSQSGVYKIFNPGSIRQQNYQIDLPFHIKSGAGAGHDMPVVWMQQTDGQNTLTVGLLDQAPTAGIEGNTYTTQFGGEGPGFANGWARVVLYRPKATPPALSFKDGLYVNADPGISWFEALSSYGAAVDAARGFKPREPGRWALNPMWHSWYAHSDQIDEAIIRDEARRARALGFTTIELDAGINLPPGTGYSLENDGHYGFDPQRFPDAKGMIGDMHRAGQRVILHVTPLIMGRNSPAYARMGDCRIRVNGKPDVHLDPRLKKVHDYLIESWETLFGEYDIDGVWIDFLELPGNTDAPPPGMEVVCEDMNLAYTRLMQSLYHKALDIDPDAVVILRRSSANLNAKTYCTHVWPMDTPQDYNMNRRDVVFMKTYGSGVLTHACCTSWPISESDVNVARQMASVTLAGVPAVSIPLGPSRASHNAIMKAWLEFYEANKRDLVMGRMTPLLPTPPSAALRIEGREQAFFGFFEAMPGLIELTGKDYSKVTLVNAFSDRTVTRLEGVRGDWQAQVFDQAWRSVEKASLKADATGMTINLAGPGACHAIVLTRIAP